MKRLLALMITATLLMTMVASLPFGSLASADTEYATLNIQEDKATDAWLWVWDETLDEYALDYTYTDPLPINGTNHQLSTQVLVTLNHCYTVWVTKDGQTYVVKVLAGNAKDWTGKGTTEAKGCATKSSGNYNIHFTLLDAEPEEPDITIIKVGEWVDRNSDGYAQPDDEINYTFTVTNTGNVTLTDVTVTDPMFTGDDAPEFVSSTEDSPEGTLLPGESATYTATYTVTQADIDAGEVVNEATVTGTAPDNSTVTDSNEETVILPQNPDIEIVKSGTLNMTVVAPTDQVNVGDEINYTFTVTNTGNVTLTNVTVTDPLVTVSGGPITLDPGASDSSTFTATYTITQDDIDAGKVDNTATATGTPPVGENVTDTDDETVNLTQEPDIEILKSGTLDMTVVAPTDQVNVGDEINYTFTVTNTGNVTLTNVTVTDPLVTVSGGPITLDPGASDSSTFTATYTITQADIDAGTDIENTATATGTAPDESTVSDEDTATVSIDAEADIEIVKTADPTSVSEAGTEVTYTFTITNTGAVTLTGVTVTDPMFTGDDAPEFVSSTEGSLEGTLLPGESATYTASYTVTQDEIDAGDDIVNTATVTTDQEVEDTDTATVTITQNADVSIVKTADPTSVSEADEIITYTFVVTNTGDVTLTDVSVIDPLPGLTTITFVSSTENSPEGTLLPGESATYTATYTVAQADIDAGADIENTATVTTDQDVSDTDTATVTIDVTPPPPPPPPPAPAFAPAGEPTCFFDVDMLGEVTRVRYACPTGHCLGDYEPEDPAQLNFLELRHWTQVSYELDGRLSNSPPRWIRMRVSDDPPPTAPGQVAVTDVYTFLGYTRTGLVVDSISFDQAVAMELDYDVDRLPENTVSVGIAVWNPEAQEWQIQPQATGRIAGVGTATADVMHFSSFAVIATTGDAVQQAPTPEPTPLPEGPAPARFATDNLGIDPVVDKLWGPITIVTRTGHSVIVTANVQNLGDEEGSYTAELVLDGEVIGSQDVSLSGGEQKQVRFVLSGVPTGDYQIQLAGLTGTFSTSREINWWLIALITAVLAGGIAWLVLRERRKRQIA